MQQRLHVGDQIGERMSFPTRAFGSALLAKQAAAGGKGEMAAGDNVASGCEHIRYPTNVPEDVYVRAQWLRA